MTTPPYSIKTSLEDINNKLTSLQFDIDHKYHSGMEHVNLLRSMDELKLRKAKLEVRLKYIH
jgi:hypothetical protein